VTKVQNRAQPGEVKDSKEPELIKAWRQIIAYRDALRTRIEDAERLVIEPLGDFDAYRASHTGPISELQEHWRNRKTHARRGAEISKAASEDVARLRRDLSTYDDAVRACTTAKKVRALANKSLDDELTAILYLILCCLHYRQDRWYARAAGRALTGLRRRSHGEVVRISVESLIVDGRAERLALGGSGKRTLLAQYVVATAVPALKLEPDARYLEKLAKQADKQRLERWGDSIPEPGNYRWKHWD
jgi:hypothetical protein